MVIGVPKEIKQCEFRVGMTPYGVEELRADGHTILIEKGAGEGSDFPDDGFLSAGAEIVEREALFNRADLIVKVKEPLPSEFGLFREQFQGPLAFIPEALVLPEFRIDNHEL